MFALGYYAGCRASDVCWFRLDQVQHLTKKSGQITVGYKRGQLRTIDLANEARKALRSYLEEERNQVQTDCPFVFLVTRMGTPAVATTARYTQPNREQMKHKLKQLSW